MAFSTNSTPTVARIPGRGVLTNLLRSTSGRIGLLILVIHIGIALTAPLWVPFDYAAQDSTATLQPPSATHLFGTDRLGRDLFTRTMLGGRTALLVTIGGTTLAMLWGGVVGIALGFLGGYLDEIVMRLLDALFAIPGLLMLLLIISSFDNHPFVLLLTLGFLFGIGPIRILRAATLDFVARDFITAARVRGERSWTIVRRELLPNVFDILMVEGSIRWSWMLLSFSSLSFLGLGITPPTPDWGLMIAEGRGIMAVAPWLTLYPILMLSTLIIGINLASDAFAKAVGIDRTQGAPV